MNTLKLGGFTLGSGGGSKPNGSPSALALTILDDYSIQCDWVNGATNHQGTYVYKSATELGTYTLAGTLTGKGTSKVITGLDADTKVYIKVVHFVGSKLSDYSNIANATTYIAEFGTIMRAYTAKPNQTVAGNLNTLVKKWVTDGVWTKLEGFALLASHTNDNGEALINLVTPGTKNLTSTSMPAFVAFEGVTGDGAANFLKSNFNPGDGGTHKFVQDSCTMFVYNRTKTATSNASFGALDANSDGIYGDFETDRATLNMNGANSDAVTGGTYPAGVDMITRNSGTAFVYYNNKSKFNLTENSITPINLEVYLIGYNGNGTPSNLCTHQISAFGYGSGMSDADNASITDGLEAYMDSNGKGVIA